MLSQVADSDVPLWPFPAADVVMIHHFCIVHSYRIVVMIRFREAGVIEKVGDKPTEPGRFVGLKASSKAVVYLTPMC